MKLGVYIMMMNNRKAQLLHRQLAATLYIIISYYDKFILQTTYRRQNLEPLLVAVVPVTLTRTYLCTMTRIPHRDGCSDLSASKSKG